MVGEVLAPDRSDPAALGAELRAQFGDHWRAVLDDLERAGLPATLAGIAAMDAPMTRPRRGACPTSRAPRPPC